MRKKLLCMFLAMAFPLIVTAAGDIPGVYKPAQVLIVPEKNILVFDRSQGLLLFQNGGNHPGKIGSFGQGPGEYDQSAFISAQPGTIYLSTRGKMIVFNFQGEVVREVRHNLDLFHHRLVPLPGGGWLADLAETDYSPKGGTTLRACIMDDNLQVQTELYRRTVPLPMREVRLFPYAAGSTIAGNRIVTAVAEDNGSLRLFDLLGKPAGAVVIPRAQWRRPTPEEIDGRMDAYRERAGDPAFWKELKKRITIPDHIPNILDFRTTAEGILVRSPDLREGKRRFLLFDFDGKFIREFLLPDAGALYDFANGAYHYLETTDEDETRPHTLPIIHPDSNPPRKT